MYFSTFLLKNLLRRKTRSLLTICGVAIAVLTTVALLGIADAFERSASDGFDLRGVDLIVLEEGAIDQLSSELDESLLDRVRAIDGVQGADGALIGLATFDVAGTVVTAMVQGWDPKGFLFDATNVTQGRSLTPADTQHVLLGYQLARNIQANLGDKVEIEGEPFEVVGIYESVVPAENSGAIVPLAALQAARIQEGKMTGFSVRLERRGDDALAEQVRSEMLELKAPTGKRERLIVYKTQEYLNESQYLKMTRGMTWLTSFIAIMVGTVGVLNTMIMSVVERIREISILRAIGWRKSRVVRMILGESLLLSVLGAFAGCAAAVLLTNFLLRLPAANGIVQQKVPLEVLGQGILLALLVGLIGGLYPSWLASRLLPSEGLRHE
jgi:putative ABC transport system permease protein